MSRSHVGHGQGQSAYLGNLEARACHAAGAGARSHKEEFTLEVPIGSKPLSGDAQEPHRRDLREWFRSLESGPAFLRREERAHWLADEHGLSSGYATAIVHEYEIRRRIRLYSG
jgi:hypothetical protein